MQGNSALIGLMCIQHIETLKRICSPPQLLHYCRHLRRQQAAVCEPIISRFQPAFAPQPLAFQIRHSTSCIQHQATETFQDPISFCTFCSEDRLKRPRVIRPPVRDTVDGKVGFAPPSLFASASLAGHSGQPPCCWDARALVAYLLHRLTCAN